ncbi:MAG: terminase TerL endonuclease subunit, partial [Candidatus Woesearchaeota archaeon]
FYRGSAGNENLKLTDEEIKLCEDLGLNTEDKGDVLKKYENGEIFRELVLVLGRRAGKDVLASLIAAYEAMKLLECPGGDPYALYELSEANTINILTVANSSDQAETAFKEIKSRILNSPYFKDKYIRDGIGTKSIYLLTPKDKKDNIEKRKQKLPPKKGSVGIIVGHSNSDSLLGMGCMVLILDEVASYKQTGGSSSGDRIYQALTPSVSTYCRKIYQTDENGNIKLNNHNQKIIKKRIYDGKIISISSPRAKEGKFYNLYKTAKEVPYRLAFRLPTWEANPTHTKASLRESSPLSEVEFMMEFGAEFSGAGAETFFTEDQVDSAFYSDISNKNIGEPGKIYFVHIDPATSSHNYALVVGHKEYYLNKETKKTEYVIIIDHIKYWRPQKGQPIDEDEVIDYIISLKRKFNIVLLTYDQWNSQANIKELRRNSIPHKMTRFSKKYKMMIYKELENLVNSKRIKIPYHELLRNEMLELKRRFTANGFKVFPKQSGDGVKSDDIIDAVAAVCYTSIEQNKNNYPQAHVIDSGGDGGGVNNRVWRSMQGTPLGYGTGQQVSQQLEKRNSFPIHRR